MSLLHVTMALAIIFPDLSCFAGIVEYLKMDAPSV